MNATTLYVEACKCMLSVSEENPGIWEELFQLLPKLRQALSCRVCRGLLVDPFGSMSCQHYVCRGCLRKKRALNPGCRWCLNLEKLEEDRQTKIVLACYQKLCEFIAESTAVKRLTTQNGEYNTTLAILHEAITSPISIDDCISDRKQVPVRRFSNSTFSPVNNSNVKSNANMAVRSRDQANRLTAEIVPLPQRKLGESKKKKKRKHFKGSIYNYNKKKKLKKLSVMAGIVQELDTLSEKIVETVQTIQNEQESTEEIHVIDDVDIDAHPVAIEKDLSSLAVAKQPRGKRCRCGVSSVGQTQRCVSKRCPCFCREESCEQCPCCKCANPFSNNNVKCSDTVKLQFVDDNTLTIS